MADLRSNIEARRVAHRKRIEEIREATRARLAKKRLTGASERPKRRIMREEDLLLGKRRRR